MKLANTQAAINAQMQPIEDKFIDEYERSDHMLQHSIDASGLQTYLGKMIWNIMSEYQEITEIAYIAIRDAEELKFEEHSSMELVVKKDGTTGISESDFKRLGGPGLEKLVKTRLMTHIYHVVLFASKFKEEVGRQMPALLLLALLHDFGKHPVIAKRHRSLEWSTHEEISGNYAKMLIQDSQDFSNEFADEFAIILAKHHIDSDSKVLLYRYLNLADHYARELERR